jgi:hypothetical protein
VIQSEISEALVGRLTIDEPSDGNCEELDPAERQHYIKPGGIVRLTIS